MCRDGINGHVTKANVDVTHASCTFRKVDVRCAWYM